MNGVVKIGNGSFHLSQALCWLKQGRIRRVPGKLEWEFANLPANKHHQMMLENFAVRLGNNLAAMINEQIEDLVRFTHDPHPMSEGERNFRQHDRGGELYRLCVTKALEEMNCPGTPFKEILADIDSQE